MAKIAFSNLPTIKISFFLVNFLFFVSIIKRHWDYYVNLKSIFFYYLKIIGIAYIGIGSWLIDALYNRPDIDAINHYYRSIGGIMTCLGILLIFLSIFGFFLSKWRHFITMIIVNIN